MFLSASTTTACLLTNSNGSAHVVAPATGKIDFFFLSFFALRRHDFLLFIGVNKIKFIHFIGVFSLDFFMTTLYIYIYISKLEIN